MKVMTKSMTRGRSKGVGVEQEASELALEMMTTAKWGRRAVSTVMVLRRKGDVAVEIQ